MPFITMRWPRSLTAQLLGISVGSLLLVMCLIAGGTAFALLSRTPFIQDDLARLADDLEKCLQFDGGGRPVGIELPRELDDQFDLLGKDVAFRVVDSQQRTVLSSIDGPALSALASADLGQASVFTSARAGSLMVLTRPLVATGTGDRGYLIQVGRSERIERLSLSHRSRIILGAGAVTMVLGTVVFCVLVLWTTRRIVQPLRDASAAASRIGPRNLMARLDPTPLPSELTPLIAAFNSVLERLQKGFRVQQEFLASVAHELKTPLTLVRAEVEASQMAGRDEALADLDGMARHVHQLLHLAEVSEAQNYAIDIVDATTLIAEAAPSLGRLAKRGTVRLDLKLPAQPVWIRADVGAFGILLKNLVENAVQHTPAGEVVTVRLNAHDLRIRNPGMRIAAGDMAQLFVRFWRGPASTHDGAGLGLAICEEIAIAHGWHLRAIDVPMPPGAEFVLVFDRSLEVDCE